MITKFGFFSRDRVIDIDPTRFGCNTMLISIGEPSCKEIPDVSPRWNIISPFFFYDVTKRVGRYAPISKKDARKMFSHIRAAQEDDKQWVVVAHCRAGISRSGAVCKFIKQYAKLGHCPQLDKYFPYNEYVYKSLCHIAKIKPMDKPALSDLYLWFDAMCNPIWEDIGGKPFTGTIGI